MVVAQIAPGRHDLLLAALTHDLHESEAGDIPYPFKRENEEVSKAYAKQEKEFAEAHGEDFPSGEVDSHILKWADMFELLLWSHRELALGNTYFRHTIRVARDALANMGSPTPEATVLISEYWSVYGD